MNQDKTCYIIAGKSGCGKGTQIDLLKKYIEEKSKLKCLHITTGGGFRDFLKEDNYTAHKSKDIINVGGLMPDFLAIYVWTKVFVEKVKGNEVLVLDGMPRRFIEVEAIKSALDFYGYKKINVIYLNVTDDWAIEKLKSRGREDDNNTEEQERKMSWFKADTLPCINFYMNSEYVNFIEINGEASVEEVQAELISKLI